MTDPAASAVAEEQTFAAEVTRFRAVLAAGRSPIFLQLFDLLVERSRDDRAPKEVEIALAIFGRDPGQNDTPDSVVRVTMYRLRKRLDEFYAGQSGLRLDIPKGEYRIVLIPAAAATPVPVTPPAPAPRNGGTPRRTRWLGVVAAVAAINGLGWWYIAARTQENTGRSSRGGFWQALPAGSSPLVAIGDSYMLAETENQKDIKQIVLEPGIRSRSDFGAYLTTHPDAFYRLYDLDLRYTPFGTAVAAWSLLPSLGAEAGGGAGPRLIASSRLTAQMLDANDIVYVGPLAALGLLAAPLFQLSGFSPDATGTTLTDRASQQRYAIRSSQVDGQESREDFGYVASIPGPSGRHILVISGFGDGGVRDMAALVRDTAQMQQLTRRIGSPAAFEALFKVRTAGSVRLARTLVTARALRAVATSTPRATRP